MFLLPEPTGLRLFHCAGVKLLWPFISWLRHWEQFQQDRLPNSSTPCAYLFSILCAESDISLLSCSDMRHVRNCPIDCASVYYNGLRRSGIYSIMPSVGGMPIEVLCEMDTEGTAPTPSPSKARGGGCLT